jgi:hypothetical protein
VKAQTIRNHTIAWGLLLLAAIVVGIFILTAKPAAQDTGAAGQPAAQTSQPAK